MGFYDKYLLPRLVHLTCGQRPAMRQRAKVVPLAEGQVLEVGIGSGLNIPLYDSSKVSRLWGLDPSAEMWSIAKENAADHDLEVEFMQSPAESIPLQENSMDSVLMTYTLCTIPDVEVALAEIRRVLKPTGRLIFCEHGYSPDENIRQWQDRLNPIWRKLAGGCNLNRPIDQLLTQSGFKSDDLQTMYLPGWKPGTFNFWGTAT